MPVLSNCERCGKVVRDKPSRAVRFCSRDCKAVAERTKPAATARPCSVCGEVFTPSRKRGDARFCSKSCIWSATRGPGFNERISRESARARGEAQRGKGSKGYVKRDGRHEHRVVAEQMLGRRLKRGEVVHHVDENKHNNAPANLKVMSQREHMRLHGLGLPGVPRRKKGAPYHADKL